MVQSGPIVVSDGNLLNAQNRERTFVVVVVVVATTTDIGRGGHGSRTMIGRLPLAKGRRGR